MKRGPYHKDIYSLGPELICPHCGASRANEPGSKWDASPCDKAIDRRREQEEKKKVTP